MSDLPAKPAPRRSAKSAVTPPEQPVTAPIDPIAEAAATVTQEAVSAIQVAQESVQQVAAPTTSISSEPTPPVTATATSEEVNMATNPNTAADTAGKAQAFFADANEKTKTAFDKGSRLFADAGDFGKGNVEALVESGRIAAKGLESIGRDVADYGRRSFESATSQMKTLATVKSPTEFVQLQSDYLRGAFDAFVAEASKSTEAVIKLAGDVAQPLSSRASIAVEKIKTVA